MRFSLLITLVTFMFLGCQTMSKPSSNSAKVAATAPKKKSQAPAVKQSASNPALAQKSIYEELTGKKALTTKQMPARVLELARDAKWKRDYVTALKRYNTLIVKYPKAKEVRQAYLDKAAIYKEMGLIQQSKYNLEKAKQ